MQIRLVKTERSYCLFFFFYACVCSGMNLILGRARTNGANRKHVTKWALALASLLRHEDK